MKLRIEYRYDPESSNWSFTVPSLGIVGGAQTREEAAQQALEAIEFTLESENEADLPGDGEVVYVQISVASG
jgi:predicted RNase H-like HicB family nuclease